MLAPPSHLGPGGLVNARRLALALPAALLGGALASQYLGGLAPCEMCYWQRWPHWAAVVLAIGALVSPIDAPRTRLLTLMAALAIAISGAIGVFHAGVEYGWWEGFTQCTAGGATSLEEIMDTPLVRCDQVQWSLLGISLAGWNALISLGGTVAIVALARRRSVA